jgi:TM2 domain-containing membrane protein YozV
MEAATRAHLTPADSAAAILSLVLPGTGQIYKGRTGMGIAWLVLTVGLYLTVFLPGVLAHFGCVLQAYWMAPSER